MALGKPFRVHGLCSGLGEKFSILLTHRNKDEALLFESNAVAQITKSEVQIIKSHYRALPESFIGCLGVLQFYTESDQLIYLVMVSEVQSAGKIGDSDIYRITMTSFINLRGPSPEDDKISEIKKVLNSGTFYFAWAGGNEPLDISLCEQKRLFTKVTDNRFFWNRTMFLHLMRYGINCHDWLLKVTCGFVEIKTIYAGVHHVKTAIISRLSCERAGTRFNVRGTNDDGHVANFVETEQIVSTGQRTTSFLQTRGSVPLFWEQPGVQVGSHKVRLSRGPEAACSALGRHLQLLKDRYGKQVIVNLLGSSLVGSKEGEAMLSSLFHSQHVNSADHCDIAHVLFDYHQEVRGQKGLEKLEREIQKHMQDFGFFSINEGNPEKYQYGTIRTNCLDCLDRTNCVQTFIGLKVLKSQLEAMEMMDKPQVLQRFEEIFRQMWVNNGNEVSKIYAGTGAIQGGSKLMDGARSAARTIQNNLLDQSKQEAIDVLLLGHTFNTELTSYSRSLLPSHYLHAPPIILRQMVKRWEDYTAPKKIKVIVGTYNVNGGKHFRSVVYKDLSLSDWLLDAAKIARTSSLVSFDEDGDLDKPADIYAVGFQEIVDLNAGNIVAASSENKKAWAEELGKILNRDRGYVLLTSLQLVGVCLYVFVRPELLGHIRDVATDSVKTGLGGATGNKGAVALRFVLYSTSICFVCSHFAAGQSQVKERDEDYAEITRKILFPMGRTLESHDYIFWCGDFNYRVDMDREEVRDLINRQEWNLLREKDQLTMERDKGNVFQGYEEGDIQFAPTYKYDLFSEDYDTSEKCRIPAWTDRVLWKRRMPLSDMAPPPDWNSGRCIHYGRAELKQSDHRPVVSVIEIEVVAVDDRKRTQTFAEIVKQLGPADATVILRSQDPAVFQAAENDDKILEELSSCGTVILVRHLGDQLWVTFRDGLSALAACKLETIQVGNYSVYISLKTQDWEGHLEKEMTLCVNNTVALLPNSSSNKSSDNYTTVEEIVEKTHMGTYMAERGDRNNVRIPPRPGPPSRPPPPRSPAAERKFPVKDDPSTISPRTSPRDSPKQEIGTLLFPTNQQQKPVQPTQPNLPPLPPRQPQNSSNPNSEPSSPKREFPSKPVESKSKGNFDDRPPIPARMTQPGSAPPIPARAPAIPPRR
ncbi:unnamed protein product [Allacma fusca]|uniref:SAC domain-containing protein n=1 Tax=Allacma fusca TaxID=39272 RepID=A0A8J2K9D1_9HEXA|nr:unnamed protein product [Allacma fusca]